MLDTNSKAIQQIKRRIEDIALSNTTGFGSNTLKHYFFDKTAIIQIQCCLLDEKQYEFTRLSTAQSFVVCLPFSVEEPGNCCRYQGVHASYVSESEPESDSISKSTTIALGHCRMPAVGDNTVTKDSDCSGTIAGSLLSFTFSKKASIVVNCDVDMSHLFTRLAGAILNSPTTSGSRDCFFR